MVTPAGALTTLYVLNGTMDGADPFGLFLASDGNLYGLTASGGANGEGTIFEVTRSGTFTTLYSFAASGDGSFAQAGLVQASDGQLLRNHRGRRKQRSWRGHQAGAFARACAARASHAQRWPPFRLAPRSR